MSADAWERMAGFAMLWVMARVGPLYIEPRKARESDQWRHRQTVPPIATVAPAGQSTKATLDGMARSEVSAGIHMYQRMSRFPMVSDSQPPKSTPTVLTRGPTNMYVRAADPTDRSCSRIRYAT